jgi:hypothetical protein
MNPGELVKSELIRTYTSAGLTLSQWRPLARSIRPYNQPGVTSFRYFTAAVVYL